MITAALSPVQVPHWPSEHPHGLPCGCQRTQVDLQNKLLGYLIPERSLCLVSKADEQTFLSLLFSGDIEVSSKCSASKSCCRSGTVCCSWTGHYLGLSALLYLIVMSVMMLNGVVSHCYQSVLHNFIHILIKHLLGSLFFVCRGIRGFWVPPGCSWLEIVPQGKGRM